MYTHCPACKARFRVRAAHLTAAHGHVRCGGCGHAFDALLYLTDTLTQAPVRSVPETDDTIHAGPALRMDSAEGEPDLPGGIRGRESDDTINELLRAPNIRHDDLDIDSVDWSEGDTPARSSRVWWLAATVLLVAILVQVSWFNRDTVYHHYPVVLPWIEQLCVHLGCEVYRERYPDAIELLNRDVRLHPVYEDVLLVNATIANRADRRQPYPYIELALYNTGGQAIAYRRFAPADYLDGSLPVAAGIPPDTPVHVVLEISGPTVDAVSFEFGFL